MCHRLSRANAKHPESHEWSRGESNPRPLECDGYAVVQQHDSGCHGLIDSKALREVTPPACGSRCHAVATDRYATAASVKATFRK